MKRGLSESRSRAVLMRTAAAVCAATVAAATVGPTEAAPEATAPASGAVTVRVGRNPEFTRVEFAGPSGVGASVRRSGRTVTVAIPGGARADVAQLRVDLPPGVVAVDSRPGAVVFTLAEGADVRFGRADGAVYVNLVRPPAASAQAVAAPARANPVPSTGVVEVEAALEGGRLTLRFPWAAPAGAAVFRRGKAVWIVFDAKARLDLSSAMSSLGPASQARWTNTADATILRLAVPEDLPVASSAEGSAWTVTVGGRPQAPQGEVALGRDDQTGPPALTAALAGATRVVWIRDPLVGDRFAAVTALGPAKGMDRKRAFVETALLPTAQGLAVEASAADLTVSIEGDLVRIARPKGLALSSPAAAEAAAQPGDAPRPAALPALIDFETWPAKGPNGFKARYNQLQDLAAAEAAGATEGEPAPVAARMALARFLIGTELSYEAIGVLDLVAHENEAMLGDAEFRGLRGAARAMVGRWVEAQTDFSVPQLAADPSAALWRGYVDARQGHWEEARRHFQQGARAVDLFAPKWRARFAAEHARAALELGDVSAASGLIRFAALQAQGAEQQLAVRLVQAQVFEAEGRTDRALRVYDAIAKAPLDQLSAPAQLRATRIRLDKGMLRPAQAVKTLDGLRYRWRGDATELELIRTLGDIYLSQGRYREALEALRSAGSRLPNLPQAVQLQADLAAAFRALFLEGQADGLEPVQALALFYDFRELTPVGAEGDDMVRRLARRLVDVDLLAQAAELLKYQVDNRLDGVAKSQVATDLAAIYLMDRKPEQALQALWGSRTTLLPNALNAERRVIEARALSDLGRYDHALEILGRDASAEAQDVRAEVKWRQKAWPEAAAMLERRLGERWKDPTPLAGEDETRLIRAGIAYSLAGDDAALARLNDRWEGFIDRARSPEALRVALSRNVETITPQQFADASAQAESFSGWVAAMKKRFREKGPAPTRTAAASANTARGA